jgi:hypothetical protein
VHDAGQVGLYRIQVHGILQSGRERGDGLIGVVAGAVEPPVHDALHPAAHGAEQGRRGQGGGGHRHAAAEPQDLSGQQDQAGVDPDQQGGDDRVGQRSTWASTAGSIRRV